MIASVQGHLVIRLEARNPVSRHQRIYQLSIDRDLFGAWIIDIRFGLLGCRGRVLRMLVDTEAAVRRIVRDRLRRRTAPPNPRRLEYRIREIIGELHWLAPVARTG